MTLSELALTLSQCKAFNFGFGVSSLTFLTETGASQIRGGGGGGGGGGGKYLAGEFWSLEGTCHSSLGEEDDEEKEGEAGLCGGSDLTLAGLKLRDGEREKERELERGYEGVREVKLVEPILLSTRELEAATAEG